VELYTLAEQVGCGGVVVPSPHERGQAWLLPASPQETSIAVESAHSPKERKA
jgi:hypothetical protein